MTMSNLLGIAGSALTAQSERMNVAASNMANADSAAGPNGEPYRAKEVQFQLQAQSGQPIGGVRVSGVIDDPSSFRQKYSPNNPLANEKGYVRMPNVNPTDEMINMISAARSYQASVNVLNTGKQLMLHTLTLGQ